MSILFCRLCRCRTDSSSSILLGTVNQEKLQTWAAANTGCHLSKTDIACWTCVREAKILSDDSISSNLDWWTGLDIPQGSDDEDSEEEYLPQNPKICYVRLCRLTEREIALAIRQDGPCLESLTKTSDETDTEAENEPQKEFQCSMCSKSYSYIHNLKVHQDNIHIDRVACKFCPNTLFENQHFLKMHCNYYHQEEIDIARMKLTCNYCDELMTNALQLKLHISSVHPIPRFECPTCLEWFPNLFNLKMHKNREHMEQNVKQDS